MSYHLLRASHVTVSDEVDLLIAGDGIYSFVRCFGMHIPFPLVLCEIRGLLPLSPLPFLEGNPVEAIPLPFAPSHHVLLQPELPTVDTGRIYQYVIARGGVFLLAGCPGIEVLMPISAPCALPGLADVAPYVIWRYPRVGEEVVQELFDQARAARDETDGHMLERLFYLTYENGWRIHEPEQIQTATSVRATTSSEADETATLEGHSHHDMHAYFSRVDNRDELVNGGFKVYFVIGQVHTHPQIRTRVCVHGYSWEVPARTFFALPAGVEDCVAKEWMTQ
ncbi:hypothetical protein KSF_107240 [Reticulibacter mediterranei]|uniref:Uncharacterized protein n=1 Tax=Reticulibacter mediterranei TaxID=2778369 RepID=A0A8J3ITT6_9CHLR|nr:hypothetical protein [Reticulibacter mediterranei]GHP00677.1 hypothetical protein KSF_107240 [Reticulibacter mediterranei]